MPPDSGLALSPEAELGTANEAAVDETPAPAFPDMDHAFPEAGAAESAEHLRSSREVRSVDGRGMWEEATAPALEGSGGCYRVYLALGPGWSSEVALVPSWQDAGGNGETEAGKAPWEVFSEDGAGTCWRMCC